MFLVGADSIPSIQRAPVVITGKTSEWLRTRGVNIEGYARRGRT
jgi:hypothetical protein